MLNPTRHPVGTGVVTTGADHVSSITVTAATGAAAFVDLRDSAAGSGARRIREINVPAGETVHLNFANLVLVTGLYAEAFTGAGAVLYVDAK
jgi:hypothetical protein